MNKSKERRKHPRKRIVLQSRIDGEDTSVECMTVDLSANGLSCIMENHLDVFTKVKITLRVPPDMRDHPTSRDLKPVECEGVVVRSEKEQEDIEGYQTAIFFNRIESDAINMIQQYVDSQKN